MGMNRRWDVLLTDDLSAQLTYLSLLYTIIWKMQEENEKKFGENVR